MIARDLDETVRAVTRPPGNSAPDWLKGLISYWHEQRCAVLSLNYDTLIETVASSIQVDDVGTISSHDIYPPLRTDAGLRSGLAPSSKQFESFRLLKAPWVNKLVLLRTSIPSG